MSSLFCLGGRPLWGMARVLLSSQSDTDRRETLMAGNHPRPALVHRDEDLVALRLADQPRLQARLTE